MSDTPKIRGERLSVYAGEPLQLVLVGNDENRSGRINTVAERYLQIVADESPTWTLAQWSAVCDALNGCWLRDEASIRYTWAEIADTEGLAEKWDVDADALTRQVRSMSYTQRVAMVEIVERFWQRAELPTLDALRQAGAKIVTDENETATEPDAPLWIEDSGCATEAIERGVSAARAALAAAGYTVDQAHAAALAAAADETHDAGAKAAWDEAERLALIAADAGPRGMLTLA